MTASCSFHGYGYSSSSADRASTHAFPFLDQLATSCCFDLPYSSGDGDGVPFTSSCSAFAPKPSTHSSSCWLTLTDCAMKSSVPPHIDHNIDGKLTWLEGQALRQFPSFL